MNAVVPVPAERVRTALTQAIPDLHRYLPPGVSPARFQATVVTAVLQNRDLMECDRDSLWNACRKAAQSGLMPDGKEGALVPRWNSKKGCKEAHWMPMVQGLIALAKRKGSVISLTSQIAYEGERFRVVLGDEERIEHERDLSKVGGKPVAVYAIAKLSTGAVEREIMSWGQVMEVRKVGADRGPWQSWADEMARKTVIRRLSKRLPILAEGDEALKEQIESVDELYDFEGKAEAAPEMDAEFEEVQPARGAITSTAEPAPPPAAPWEGMAWPVCTRDGRCEDFGDPDAWEAELQKRIATVQQRELLGEDAKRKAIGQILDANRGAMEALRERGFGDIVQSVADLFRAALGETEGAA
jgi:phage RecT family recombinase